MMSMTIAAWDEVSALEDELEYAGGDAFEPWRGDARGSATAAACEARIDVVGSGFEEGVMTILNDGSVRREFSNGEVRTERPDGVTIQDNPDGTSLLSYPDGTVQYFAEDGTITTIEPDGTVRSRRANEQETAAAPAAND